MSRILYRLMVKVKSDRGEGPVPYVIIVAVMSVAAAAIAAAVWGIAEGWLDDISTKLPGPRQ
ncbi:MAG TPA: hypothetical protein VFC19_39065 [Candidatus Limnocylindrales bacterium]|nr:hypothetical protein [Candidatus Limnocylindrales bacterium]